MTVQMHDMVVRPFKSDFEFPVTYFQNVQNFLMPQIIFLKHNLHF